MRPLRLIDDPDDEVFDTVASQLLHYGKEIIPNSSNYGKQRSEDQKVQERIELLIHRVHFHNLQQDFPNGAKQKHP